MGPAKTRHDIAPARRCRASRSVASDYGMRNGELPLPLPAPAPGALLAMAML